MTAFSMKAVSCKIGAQIGLWSVLTGMAFADGLSPEPIAPQSDDNPLVVELFTSQGCVSCPPADEFFATLVQDPRLLPLSLHVDYWDYIGWQDNFAKAEFTERQKRYARAIGSRTIYTPQFIIGGEARVEGFVPEKLAEATKAGGADAAPLQQVHLRAERRGENLTIIADADPPLSEAVRVQLVRYIPSQTVQIERGENAGKTVTYHNVVTSWTLLGDWRGDEDLHVDVPIMGDEPGAVIVQRIGPAKILAAALVREAAQ